MQTVRKLLVTFFVMVMSISCFNAIAYAEEINASKNDITAQEAVTEETDNTDATNELNNDAIQIEDEVKDVSLDDAGQDIDKSKTDLKDTEKKNDVDVKKDTKKETTSKTKTTTTSKTSTTKAATREEKVKPSYSKKDLRLLSCLIYTEAGNQSYQGMLAVANVVLNRVKSNVFWHVDTVSEAIYDKKWSVQFAVTIKNKSTGLSAMDKALKIYDSRNFTGPNPAAQEKAMNKAIKAAKAALQGENNIGTYLCFQNKRIAPTIKKKYSTYKIIGDHIFYRAK